MSEDDSSPKRKKKLKLRVMSESESDDEGELVRTRTNLRVLSEDESSDSSVPEARRTRKLPQLRDYRDESGSSEWESGHSDDEQGCDPTCPPTTTGCASDSSEGNSDKCPICLLRFSDQMVGIPEHCEHLFCVDCITEWSKNVNTCPVDRLTFSKIVVRSCAGGRVLHTREVQVRENSDLFSDDIMRCQICESSESGATMLLCDLCDQGFHMQCLTPPLQEIPEGDWYCTNCAPRVTIDLDMSNMFMERLEARFGRARRSRNEIQAEPSTSTGTSSSTGVSSSARGGRRKVSATGRRKTRRRNRTVVTEYEITEGNKFPLKRKVPVKSRVKKRKPKKRVPRTAARRLLVRASVRERLASLRSQMRQLASASECVQDLTATRHRAGIPTLNLFGDHNQLEYFSEDEHDESGSGPMAVALRPSASVLSTYRQARRKMISIQSPPHASSAPDLLSNIMESQTLLHSKRSLLSITVDGKVNIKIQGSSSGKKPTKENPDRDGTPIRKDSDRVKDDRIDLTTGEDAAKKAPSYPGQSRGGGWGTGSGEGYRGGYQNRGDQGNNNPNRSGGNYGQNNVNYAGGGNYGGNYRGSGGSFQGNADNSYQSTNAWHGDSGPNFPERRRDQFEEDEYSNRNLHRLMNDDPFNNRNNTQRQNNPPLIDNDCYNRPNMQNLPPHMGDSFSRHNVSRHVPPALEEIPFNANNRQRLIPPPAEDDLYSRPNVQRPPPTIGGGTGGYLRSLSDQGRPSLAPSWQPYQSDVPQRTPQNISRHSFGGFEQGMDALDMRVGQSEPIEGPMNLYDDIVQPRENTPPQHYEPLPEPPVFRFEKPPDDEDDESLVIDTEKYDPTEPTLDESSGEDDGPDRKSIEGRISDRPVDNTYVSEFNRHQDVSFGPQLPVEHVPASTLKVPPTLLDKAVQQVLNEHRNLIGPSHVNRSIVDYKSDEESEGDCPNFSIYSATSVNIANSTGASILAGSSKPLENEFLENEEDLVQEDDDIPLIEEIPAVEPPTEKADSFKEPEPVDEDKETMSAKERAAQDEYKERLSRRCPITPNKRNPIKIKLNNTPTLIKRHILELYADEDEEEELDEPKKEPKKDKASTKIEKAGPKLDPPKNSNNSPKGKHDSPKNTQHSPKDKDDDTCPNIPLLSENESSITSALTDLIKSAESNLLDADDLDSVNILKEVTKSKDSSENEEDISKKSTGQEHQNHSEGENYASDDGLQDTIPAHKHEDSSENCGENLEKMTESISESEDERSYTPCLDENKSKDTSLENEKENAGIEGLDTEMISEEEGNEMFSDADEQKEESDRESSPPSPRKELALGEEEGEIIDKRKELENKKTDEEGDKDEGKKKKRKEKKPTSKVKGKTKKSDITFKKLSKSGKERNYRDKEEKGKTKSKDRKKSDDKESREKAKEKRREKRKDMERYDVRNIVSEKRRRVKDAFGRDSSRPRSKSPSAPPSLSPPLRSLSRGRRSLSLAGVRRSLSITRIRRSLSLEKERYTPSIGRSISRARKSMTPVRHPISPRPRLSLSPRCKSPLSPLIHQSISPPMRRSITPRIRRSISPQMRKSISPRMRRSISPRLRRSVSPRLRRSISPRPRRSMSPRGRRSVSHRKRKSISPRVRRKIRRSISPRKRSVSPRRRRTLSRGRKRGRRSPSKSPKPKKSPRKKARRSRSRLGSLSRNRSRTPKPKKIRRTKARKSRSPKRKSPKPSKKRPVALRSVTPELMLSPERIRERVPSAWRNDKAMYQEWSDSRSMNSRLMTPSWTPPREPSPDPRHLRVYLANKDKTKRKEKKKRQRETERRPKQLRRGPDVGPSKEVFTSGNNILVSVSFNKDEITENQDPTAVDLGNKKRKRKGDPKKDKKDRLKKRRLERKNKELENKKPVAIIDLEKSPFRELTPSPKNVIVLSDSDHCEKEDEVNQRQQILRNELREPPLVQEAVNVPTHREQTFINTVGPKTPPEPSVKFSLMPKTNAQLRTVNPLHEEEEEDGEHHDEPENEDNNIEKHKDGTHKGPNTPPDPPNTPPSSPDAYDPFEPTKSGSATPEQDVDQNGDANMDQQEKATITLETAQKTNLSADDVLNQRPITPIEKVMALLQSTRNVSPTNVIDDLSIEQPMETESSSLMGTNGNTGQSPDHTNAVAANKTVPPQSHFSVSVAPTVSSSAPIYLSTGIPRIGAFTNAPSPRANTAMQASSNQRIVLPSPTKSSPLKSQPAKLFLAKPSPIKSTPIKPMPSKTIISKLPLPSIKPIPGRKKNNRAADIIDLDMDMDSPYSPGSSDFGDLFEPPSDSKSYPKSGKTDIFDTLFGSKPKKSKSSATKVPVKHIKKKGNKTQVGVRIDDDSLKILDDLPSSAVEMQVKSKFLKKLNRQERVVEEVKLVLKPHYNKKHVTKEQYKDILRRTVPKICHNKTGEINPSKIQALVEAYVRKYRKKNKSTV